jgi:hypothetical protein
MKRLTNGKDYSRESDWERRVSLKEKSSNPLAQTAKYLPTSGTEPVRGPGTPPNCDTPNNKTIMQYGPEFFKKSASNPRKTPGL